MTGPVPVLAPVMIATLPESLPTALVIASSYFSLLIERSRTSRESSPPIADFQARSRERSAAKTPANRLRDWSERVLRRVEHSIVANSARGTGFSVRPSDRSAGARMVQGAGIGPNHGGRPRTAQPITPRTHPHRETKYGVGLIVGVGARVAERSHALGREQAHAVELSFIGQHREEPRNGARVHDSAGARDTSAPHVGTAEDLFETADLGRDTFQKRGIGRHLHVRWIDQPRHPGFNRVGDTD